MTNSHTQIEHSASTRCPAGRLSSGTIPVNRIAAPIVLAICVIASTHASADGNSDINDGTNWMAYGRAYDETHYSPLTDINASNVSRLRLAWWVDIPGIVQATSVPLEANGRLYFATGYSVVHAVDAVTGRQLWTYDPQVARAAGPKLRIPWAIRGIALWNKKVYVGTHDGRLIAIDADSGKAIWAVLTTEPGDRRVITGPPLAFKGRILIGHGKAEYGPVRGYVTAYDAETGKELWRFFTVPGDPKKPFESKALEMASTTWSGEWWKNGGGGAVWNAMTYDPEFNCVYIGTGNGFPVDARIRSPAGGDNLFLASIVALNADTGTYLWHYQTNPGETWDYDTTNDIELAELDINGTRRRVLMNASKNGFFYVLDRATGKLVSAGKFAKVTWADRVDLTTGRPVETANARALAGTPSIWPTWIGAHNLQPMAFSALNQLVYMSVLDQSEQGNNTMFANHFDIQKSLSSSLMAWDPVKQRAVWRVALPGLWNGGVVATAGNLVFEGKTDGQFAAYAADTGKELWSFDAQVGINGAPITYKVANRQYVSVMAGVGGLGSMLGSTWDARTVSRRLLTFTLDGDSRLPPPPPRQNIMPIHDSGYNLSIADERNGAALYESNACDHCHGRGAVAGGAGPDLRASPAILSSAAFMSVVKDGALLEAGMPRFDELSNADLENIRQYVRAQADKLATPYLHALLGIAARVLEHVILSFVLLTSLIFSFVLYLRKNT
ncbi:MAG TPA: PQQ-dependent dehydrogenase, methanol/ethanol family [Steroidobacteraceae bacterium]|nr:PQQ-dependent dehydrogenase, methanol/ethanol family [Steroidobacteraceae bacterium]